jgi:hypothetical protein
LQYNENIRKKAAEYQPSENGDTVQQMFKSSMEKCRNIIEDRMGHLSWTGKEVSIYRAAESAEISDLVELFLSLDDQFPEEFQTKCRERPEEPIDQR